MIGPPYSLFSPPGSTLSTFSFADGRFPSSALGTRRTRPPFLQKAGDECLKMSYTKADLCSRKKCLFCDTTRAPTIPGSRLRQAGPRQFVAMGFRGAIFAPAEPTTSGLVTAQAPWAQTKNSQRNSPSNSPPIQDAGIYL